MSIKKLRTLGSRLIRKNPYWEYKLDSYTLPGGGSGLYHYVHSPGSVMVVPLDASGRLVMVRQFRYLWKKESLEFPSGGVKSTSFLDCAKNELAEEAGLAASRIRLVVAFNPANGITDEVCKLYFATGLSPRIKEKDRSEDFEIIRITPSLFRKKVRSGQIWDGMTLAAWVLAEPHVVNYLKRMSG